MFVVARDDDVDKPRLPERTRELLDSPPAQAEELELARGQPALRPAIVAKVRDRGLRHEIGLDSIGGQRQPIAVLCLPLPDAPALSQEAVDRVEVHDQSSIRREVIDEALQCAHRRGTIGDQLQRSGRDDDRFEAFVVREALERLPRQLGGE